MCDSECLGIRIRFGVMIFDFVFVFFCNFMSTRSGFRIGSGFNRSEHNPIGLTQLHPIGFYSQPDLIRTRNFSDRVRSYRIVLGILPTPTISH